MTDIVRGAAIKGMTRPSKRFNEGRVCAKKGCTTKLSKYNKAEYCHAHAPVRFPLRTLTGTGPLPLPVPSQKMQNASAMPVRFARLVTDRKQRVASMP